MHELIDSHEEKCGKELPKKFVPWAWHVSLLGAVIFVIGGSSAYTVTESVNTKNIAQTAISKTIELKEQNKEFAKKIENLEQMNKTVLAIYDIVRKMEDKK
jgi:hypothetical protein